MKKLVTFFSASSVTRKAAEELAKVADANLYEIRPKEPYTAKDLDWRDKKSRSSLEMQDESSRPEIEGSLLDISDYDTIYIGFPIWWGVCPRIVNTFIESVNLEGKDIVLFATSGGSQMPYALNDIKKKYPYLRIMGSKLIKGPVTSDII